jgi:broad specificity phosphatase PhoE
VPHRFVFVSHPNVAIDAAVPVPQWPLSESGRRRMRAGLAQPWVSTLTAIYSSTERKAVEAAEILADHLRLPFTQVEALGENDRSATGFLAPAEFEKVADEFFAYPDKSVRGWERAADAQARIVDAVRKIDLEERSAGPVALVSHGAVGTLLYCWLTGRPISRAWDQPPNGGGNHFGFNMQPPAAHGHWQAIDAA